MTSTDLVMVALTCWRENRGGGEPGMHAVGNVIMNRARQRTETPYEVCVAPWQFSSITAKGDPQLGLWPKITDLEWETAQEIAAKAMLGTLDDITDGATSYYALSMAEPPAWAARMTPTVQVAGQAFFK